MTKALKQRLFNAKGEAKFLLSQVAAGKFRWRKKMEDAEVAILNFDGDSDAALFGVFDGHSGKEVALYLHHVSCYAAGTTASK